MKMYISLLLVSALTMMSFVAPAPGLSEPERAQATKILSETRESLMAQIKGLSAAQLNFKATPDSWSVAECVEHIAISETNIFGMVEGAMKGPGDPSKHGEVKVTDDQLVNMITDRSRKVKTSEAFVPSGKFGSFEGTVKEFNEKREKNINYVKTTKDDLRNHYADTPFGKVDAFQVILFMAGHSKRHILQIEEVKANPNFPKK